MAETTTIIDGTEHRTPLPFYEDNWNIPIGETLLLTFRYKLNDSEVNLTDAEVSNAILDFYGPNLFYFDSLTGYWTVEVLFDTPAPEAVCDIRFSTDNYVDQMISRELVITRIPMELISDWDVPATATIYVGTTFTFALYLNDTYHNIGVTNATVEALPSEGLTGAQIFIDEDLLHRGYYNVTINVLQQSSGTITFIASKDAGIYGIEDDYELIAAVQYFVTLEFTALMNALIFVGSIGAVVLMLALIGWILWARVYSIPWEVRRLRKLAKTVEKDEVYKLGRKDLKRFQARAVTMQSKVDTAMGTIGVAATSAMIPTTEEVEEITATEEDIMTELDKIPGLGPEEKTVLANEMRKIPRKDRIWFLDDLKRQMTQRRMDFLTQREEPPTPPPEVTPAEAPPEAVPTETPPVKPETPPLEEVPPAEPPEPKALKEDRTAPTVLPPELQEAPAALPGVVAEIHRELDKIPGLSNEEKAALVDHLKYLSKEERQATYNSLRQNAEMDE
jgi:hypothetical protein